MKKVITYGTFDLLHVGHINILRRAKELGDYLIVVLSTDEFNAIKNKKAYYSYEDRKQILEAIRYVDKVIPENTWAVFPCKGSMPEALQKVNTEIFKEWLPGNSDYEIAGMYNIEYYTAPCDYPKGNQDENYYCEIWMPVKSKEQ